MDLVVVAGDLCAHHGYLTETEQCIGDKMSVVARGIDNRGRLAKICPDRMLSLLNTSNFQNKLTCPPSTSLCWIQTDHIVIGHR